MERGQGADASALPREELELIGRRGLVPEGGRFWSPGLIGLIGKIALKVNKNPESLCRSGRKPKLLSLLFMEYILVGDYHAY